MDKKKIEYTVDKVEELERAMRCYKQDIKNIIDERDRILKQRDDSYSALMKENQVLKIEFNEFEKSWQYSVDKMKEMYKENQRLKEDAYIGRMFKWAIKENVEFVSLKGFYNYDLEIINEVDLTRLKEIYKKEGNLLKCNKKEVEE